MGVFALRHSVPMEITLNALNHLDLLARLIKCDGMRVVSSEENLKHFEWVAVESVARDLLLAVDVSTLQAFLAITIVGFSQLRCGKDLESLANLAELVVGLGHRLRVLQWVVGNSQYPELLSNVLVACISAYSQRLVVILAHLFSSVAISLLSVTNN